MRRKLTLAVIALALAASAAACGGGEGAQPTSEEQSRDAPLSNNSVPSILGPAQRARDTADRVENQQNQTDQQTNSGAYDP
jgi:hypothetical protein